MPADTPHILTHEMAGATELEVVDGHGPWSTLRVLDGLQRSAHLRQALSETLAAAPAQGLFFECAPFDAETLDRPFRAAWVPSPAMGRLIEDPQPFRHQLRGARAPDVVTFANLSGDAVLVVPAGPGRSHSHAHLAAFLRGALPAQIERLWTQVGLAVVERLAARPGPLWLSTSGLGVSWLHIRLDQRPKYYSWATFRAWPTRR